MILIIDNFDSFVHNISRYIRLCGKQTTIVRNNQITLSEIKRLNPSHIILSPGPCTPDQAGITVEVIKKFFDKIPMLGICLGHQAIGQAFGAKIIHADVPMHGKASSIYHQQTSIFRNIPNPLVVGRYHSLIIKQLSMPSCLKVTARCDSKQIMAIQHLKFPVYGVQFHPESILTKQGIELIGNFLYATHQ